MSWRSPHSDLMRDIERPSGFPGCVGEIGRWRLRWLDDILVRRLVVSLDRSIDSGEDLSLLGYGPLGAPRGLWKG